MDMEKVKKVAFNSCIKLADVEIDQFVEEFKEVIELFSKVDEVDTEGVEPAFHPIELENAMREDVIEETLTQEQALSLAKDKKDGFFKGPKIK